MPKLYTIGHSTRSFAELLALLEANQITHLIDVRTIPKSRRFPWFNKNELSRALKKEQIDYTHVPQLGGLRHTRKDSINQGWRNKSFRGFADYMQTPEFYTGLQILKQLTKGRAHIAIMCAEAVPWRCHRSLVADALIIRGVKVLHIISSSAPQEHELTAFAVVDKTTRPITLFYPEITQ